MNRQHKNPSGRAFIWAMTGLLHMNVMNLQADGEAGNGKQGKNQRQLQQKLALVERMLYQSPLGEAAMKDPSGMEPAVYKAWSGAKLSFELAVDSLEKQNGGNASASLNSALAFYREASALNREAKKAEVDFPALLSDLKNRVEGYRESLNRIAEEKNIPVADRLGNIEVDEALATVKGYEEQGEIEKAVQVLQSLQAAMESELVLIRSGETLVSIVEFENLEEAFEFEIRKNESNEKLLELLFRNNTLSDGKRQLISQYLQESRDANVRAIQFRQQGKLEAALMTLESGTEAQTRALKLFGVNM